METRTRAPLGNKTTNAKARADRSAGVKDLVKEIEKTQLKQATIQKPKHKSLEPASAKLAIHTDNDGALSEVDEPEYAPLQPAPLPYQSDVLPQRGLTFEGLKKDNFLKGFYENFHNPLDDDGVSREEKRFGEEMEAVLKIAEEHNQRETAGLDWNIEDVVATVPSSHRRHGLHVESVPSQGKLVKKATKKHPATLTSRRAASALAISSDSQKMEAGRQASGYDLRQLGRGSSIKNNDRLQQGPDNIVHGSG
ncbi:hypothetical protein CDD83_1870 [Cordyceps sp. RAO-2017]|nr:hypothetical protein CDD83_1870 [Cordyceps sp. RAO-2017]